MQFLLVWICGGFLACREDHEGKGPGEGGLLMSTPENLHLGQNLSLKFYYDSAAGIDCIQAPGEVIRVDRLVNSGKEYRCAVRFSDLPPDFLKRLRKFLKSLY